jgi:hypothetical protein
LILPNETLPTDPVRELMLERGLTVRASSVGSINEQDRSFEAVAATESRVQVIDWQRYEIIDEILIARGGHFADYVVLLDNHQRHSGVNAVMGSAGEFRRKGGEWIGRGTIGRAVEGNIHREQAWQDIRDGHLRAVSIGYRVADAIEIPAGRKARVGGQTFEAGERTLRVSTEWYTHELSLTPIGADSMALIRSHQGLVARTSKPRSYFR